MQSPVSGQVCGLHFLHPGLRFRAVLEDGHQVDTRSKDFLLMKKLLVMSCTNSAFSRVKVQEGRSLFSKTVGKNTLNFLLTLSSSFPGKSGLQGRWATAAIRVGRTENGSSLFLPEQCGSRHTPVGSPSRSPLCSVLTMCLRQRLTAVP